MRIAIIGGGGAGLVAAWSLAAAHDVTLYESEPVLGGNIRTVGRNVTANVQPALAEGLYLDAGVIEFPRPWFPRFHALMQVLGVRMHDVPGTSALFQLDGRQHFSPAGILHTPRDTRWKIQAMARLAPMYAARRAFMERTANATAEELYAYPFVHFLDDGDLRTWLRLLCTYAWSIPLPQVDDIPAALAVPVMRGIVSNIEWSSVEGGAYAYVERILEQLEKDRARIHVGTPVMGLRRDEHGVHVRVPDGTVAMFDAVVLATTPDRVLPMLEDADAEERAWFGAWNGNDAETVLHADRAMYARRDVAWAGEFDVFETPSGHGGYNANVDRLNQVPETRAGFSLALGMDHEIHASNVVHRQQHHSPLYTVEALKPRETVRARNGHRHTWYAGAWLHDGLHEGAVRSGLEVGARLGGRTVPD